MTPIDGPQHRVLLVFRTMWIAPAVAVCAAAAAGIVRWTGSWPLAALVALPVTALVAWRRWSVLRHRQDLVGDRYRLARAVQRHPRHHRGAMTQWPDDSPAWEISLDLLERHLLERRQTGGFFAIGPDDRAWQRSVLERIAEAASRCHAGRQRRRRALKLLIAVGPESGPWVRAYLDEVGPVPLLELREMPGAAFGLATELVYERWRQSRLDSTAVAALVERLDFDRRLGLLQHEYASRPRPEGGWPYQGLPAWLCRDLAAELSRRDDRQAEAEHVLRTGLEPNPELIGELSALLRKAGRHAEEEEVIRQQVAHGSRPAIRALDDLLGFHGRGREQRSLWDEHPELFAWRRRPETPGHLYPGPSVSPATFGGLSGYSGGGGC